MNWRDWLNPLWCPITQFYVDRRFKKTTVFNTQKEKLLILPLPTTSRLSPCYWHTIGFIFGWSFARQQIAQLMKEHKAFYYLIHPADFLGTEDMEPRFGHALERMSFPLKKKLSRLEEVFEKLTDSGHPIKTMAELA